MFCATCGKPIEKEYYRCLDNFLQVKYFEDADNKDNTFCSPECFCKALSLEHAYVEEMEETVEKEEEGSSGLYELYYGDLIPAAQQALLKSAGVKGPEEMNWDSLPITEMTFCSDEEEE